MKKVIVFGGGTGLSTLLKGLKLFPLEITAVVAVSDNGGSTGRLAKEFNIPAMGDIRQVISALSETEEVEKILQYRFNCESELDGHPIGNLILTSLVDMEGSMTKAIEKMSDILKLKGEVLPLTEDVSTLVAKMENGEKIEGEDEITKAGKKIKKIYYKKEPKASPLVLKKTEEADYIIFSMGSLYTSLLPHFLIKDVVKALNKTKAKKIYVSNIMTQHGETDSFKVSDCINVINSCTKKRLVDTVIVNKEKIKDKSLLKRYKKDDCSEVLKVDKKTLKEMNLEIIEANLVKLVIDKNFKQNNIKTKMIRHDSMELALTIFSYIADRR